MAARAEPPLPTHGPGGEAASLLAPGRSRVPAGRASEMVNVSNAFFAIHGSSLSLVSVAHTSRISLQLAEGDNLYRFGSNGPSGILQSREKNALEVKD
ncbi:unnamed protein product [Coccothraustes coccothraustes]